MGIVSKAIAHPLKATLLCAIISTCLPGATALAAGQTTCREGHASYQCSYTCDNAPDDVPNIHAAIAQVSGHGGGVVSLSSGICQVNQPISFEDGLTTYHNVWLKGAGSGPKGTLLKRSTFVLNANMIEAKLGLPPGSVTPTNHAIKVTDMAIDPGPLVVTWKSARAFPQNTQTIELPRSVFPEAFGCRPNGLQCSDNYALVGFIDVSRIGAAASVSTPSPKPPVIVLPAGGNVSSVKSNHFRTEITLCNPGRSPSGASLCDPTANSIAQGDTLAVFAGGGGVDIEYVDGVELNNLNMLHGSRVSFEADSNFVLSNSSFQTEDRLQQFFCGGGVFVGRNAPLSHDGLIVNNSIKYSGMEIDSFNTVVSNNTIIPTACGGINGSLGQNTVFQGNTVYKPANVPTHGQPAIPFNHDYLVNEAMQIWNPGATIVDNVVFGNLGAGILSGGSNSVISRNVAYDNAQSPLYNRGLGGSGIFIQGPSPDRVTTGSIITSNKSCNTGGYNPHPANPNCIVSYNSGFQKYAFQTLDWTQGNMFSPAEHLYIGSSGVAVSSGSSGSLGISVNLPEATIVATPCTVVAPETTCNSTVEWTSTSVVQAHIYVTDSHNPSSMKLFASGRTGSRQFRHTGQNINVFRVVSDQGLCLASITLQPNVSTN